MAKVLRCKDLGFACDHVIEADTVEEVLEAAAGHAREAHQVAHVSQEMLEQLRQAIQEA